MGHVTYSARLVGEERGLGGIAIQLESKFNHNGLGVERKICPQHGYVLHDVLREP